MIDYSIIIPCLNEENEILNKTDFYHNLEKKLKAEIIFIDGMSSDKSIYIAKNISKKVFKCNAQRSRQMNLGSTYCKGKYLLFLHADTFINSKSIESLTNLPNDFKWGFFNIHFDCSELKYRLLSKCINLRSYIFKYFTGDQCLVIKKELFVKVGGFKNMDLMEDIDISRRLRKICNPYIFQGNAITSFRRWELSGFLKTIIKMRLLRILYYLGIPTRILNSIYNYK